MKKWNVERAGGCELVTAYKFEVHPSGALIFLDHQGEAPFRTFSAGLVLAPGQWISVVPEESN